MVTKQDSFSVRGAHPHNGDRTNTFNLSFDVGLKLCFFDGSGVDSFHFFLPTSIEKVNF